MLRSFLLFFASLMVALVACDCGSNPPPVKEECTANQLECVRDGETVCVTYNDSDLCEPWEQCSNATCDANGDVVCTCVPKPPLNPGTRVAYAKSTQLANGALIVAGYNPGLSNTQYHDLNVGWWNRTGSDDVCEQGTIVWETVKGIPAGVVPSADPSGPRGGISATGDIVGKYTGIVALGEEGNDVLVTYHNATEGTLEAAYGTFTGTGPDDVSFEWTFHTIDPDGGIAVLWTDVTVGNDGFPVVAYTVVKAPDLEEDITQPQYSQRVATATVAAPAAPEDWTFETISEGNAHCSANIPCATGYFCALAGYFGVCAEVVPESAGGCTNSNDEFTCAKGGGIGSVSETCVSTSEIPAGFCDDEKHPGTCCVQAAELVDYPPTPGLYNDIEATADGLALLSYSRPEGRLLLHRKTGAGWVGPTCIAGCQPSEDAGMDASMVVDGTTIHVAYTDGIGRGSVNYVRVNATNGNPDNNSRMIVDDGTAAYYADRTEPGFVGHNSDIAVVNGEVRIVYSDTALLESLIAHRAANAANNVPWTIEAYGNLADDGHFPTIVVDALAEAGDVTLVTSTYRSTGRVQASNTCAYTYPLPEPELELEPETP